jgi:peroxiredoxin
MFCREQVGQLRDKIDEIRIRGGELVIIGNGSAYFAKAFKEDFELDCPVLVDTDLRSYRAAGLRRGRMELLSPQVPLNAIRALKSGARQDGVQGDPWQLGGVFVIRPDGEVTYRYVSDAAGDHAPLSEVFSALNSKAPELLVPFWIRLSFPRSIEPDLSCTALDLIQQTLMLTFRTSVALSREQILGSGSRPRFLSLTLVQRLCCYAETMRKAPKPRTRFENKLAITG